MRELEGAGGLDLGLEDGRERGAGAGAGAGCWVLVANKGLMVQVHLCKPGSWAGTACRLAGQAGQAGQAGRWNNDGGWTYSTVVVVH